MALTWVYIHYMDMSKYMDMYMNMYMYMYMCMYMYMYMFMYYVFEYNTQQQVRGTQSHNSVAHALWLCQHATSFGRGLVDRPSFHSSAR